MCGAAEEIQDYFSKEPNQKGELIQYCHIRENNGLRSLFYRAPEGGIDWKLEEGIGVTLCCNLSNNEQKRIILPSQDQLQDMCRGQTIFDVFDDFNSFVFIPAPTQARGVMITKRCAQFSTGEQLWLAFLYHSTLQKRWNGEKWEKFSLSYRYKET